MAENQNKAVVEDKAIVQDKAPGDKVAVDKVAHVVETETQQGFRGGAEVDTTPNENYTVAGVTAAKPTPETDEDAAKAVGSPKQFNI